MKSHSKRILSLVFALLMAFQQVMFAAQTVDLLTPAEQTQTVDLLTGEEENKTVDLLTPAEPSAPIEQPIEQSKPIIEENKETENQTVDLLTPGDDKIVSTERKKSTTTILIGGEEDEETQEDSWDLTPAEITLPEENRDEEEKKDATFEDEEHHENAGVLPWSTDLVKPWSIYREPKKVYRPGEDLDLTELLVEIKTGRSGSLYNIEDLINDEFTTITRTRKSDGEKVRLDDKIYEDETMTIHMDGCQDLTIDFTVDENLKDEEEALEAFQDNLIREEFRDGLDFSLYLIKKGERENPIVAYSLDSHKLTPIGNGVDKKLKDGPLFDLKDINTWDRFDIETIGKVKAILGRSAEIKNTENVRKKLITQLAIWNVTSNIIPREIDATVSEIEETETNDFGPELKPVDEEEVPEEKEEEPIEIIDPTTPEEEIESVKQDDEVEAVEEQTEIEETAEEKTEAEEPVEENTQENKESEKIEEQAPVQSTVHKIVFDVRDIDLPYNEVELSDEEYALYNGLTSLEAIELKSEDEDLKIYEPIIEETENPYADLVTIGESDIDSIERVETEVTFDAVDYSFQNIYHTLETSSMLGFGQPRDFNVLLKATMKASRKIVEGDKFEVEILSKTLPILNGEEGRANDIQIDGKVVATAEYIAEEHKIVYTFVEDLDTDKVEIEQEFKQIKEEKAALLNMLDVSENLVLDAVRGAEGAEDSEENPDELEISPEFEENLIELKLGNTPVQYNGVSFETKKFRLKTSMTAKAVPMWKIPKGWTFDVNIGPYLKPEYDENSEPILKPLYDPNNPRDEIATPTYDPKTHTITYKYVKDVLNTKKIDIDQLLAFDTKEIGDKDKINIDITVKPKGNPIQKMYTITVRRDDPRTEIPSLFELDINENGEPNLNDGYEFFEYGPSYKVTFDASATPIVENQEITSVEWTVVFDGNGENLNSKNLDLITNFTAVRNSGLEKIEEVTINGQGITLNDNDMGDKFLINDSKYFDGHNNSQSVYTFKFKTPVDSKQKAYVLDIAAKLRGVKKTGAVRLIMPAYEGARLEMVSPNDMTHSNRTTISGKFTSEKSAEWIVTEEVSSGDQGALPLIERNISDNQILDSLNVAYYGLDSSPENNGKMHQISGQTVRKDNPIAAGNLATKTTFVPGTIAVYEYKTSLLNSDEPETYTLSDGAISKYRDVDLNVVWSKQIENAKYPAETVTLKEKDGDNKFSVDIPAESTSRNQSEVNTKIPSVKIWDIDQYGKPQKIIYTINQDMPTEGNHYGTPVQYGEVFKTYEQGRSRYEIQNYIAEKKSSKFGKISINKTDEGGTPLSGAVFRLYGVQDTEEQNKSKTLAFSGTSSVEGKIEFSSVPPGVYTLQEERSPIGYEQPVETDRIVVNEDGSVEWTNDLISSVSYETGSAATGWKSDTKYYNGSFSWPGYMNTLDYTEVDSNNNTFTSYIMLKPDVNTIREGTEYFYTDRSTRVSMFGEKLNITGAQIFDVDSDDRDIVKKAMYERNVDKLFLERPNTLHQYTLTNDISNAANNNGTIVKDENYNDTFLGKTVHAIMLPYKRFGDPNPGWGFLIKVTGIIDDSAKDSTFSYRWLTMTEPKENNLKNKVDDDEIGKQTKIESDTLIPAANNRNSAFEPTFTITNKPAKMTSLNIQKQDDKGNQLSGAEFRLYNAYGELIKSGTTSSKGKLIFEGLAPGEYKLKETRSPNGYDNPELEFTLRVSQDGSILYSATDKNGNVVEEGDYYRVGNNTSTGPVDPQGESKITVQSAKMYLDEGEKYGKRPGVWEEAAYESYSFEGVFDIRNSGPGDSWTMDFDDNWNFTQWSGKLPDIKSNTGELIATGKIDYTNNKITYTLANSDYVNNHKKQIIAEIKLNSIRPSKYYVKNNGIYSFRDIINVGINQKTIDTTVNADLFQFYGERGGNQYITQNVDIYKDKNEDRYFLRNIALFNAKGVKNFTGDQVARIYYGSSINNGREILFGDKQEPTYKPVKVIVYKVEHPNSDNMPLSCGIRPSTRPDIYTKIAEYNDFSKNFVDGRQGRVTMNFNPGRVNINDNYRPSLDSNDKVQFLITLPDKVNGYVIEQFYQINEGKEELARFENTYTQTFMFHNGGSKTGGYEQIRPTLNSGAGIGGDYTPPQPKNYDLTVFNKKEPGEFIVKKISKKDSQDKIKTLSGAEFILLDERNYVVRKESSNINGIVEFKGLSEGTYTLKETASPEGYKPTDKTLTVKVDAKGTVTFPDLKDNDEVFRKATKNELVKKVKRTLTHENDTSQPLQTHAGYPAFMNILSKVMQKSDDTVKTRIYLNPKIHSTEGKGPNKKTVLSLESLNADSISTTVYEVPEAYKGDIDGYLNYNSNIASNVNKISENKIEFTAHGNNRWYGSAYVIDVEAKYDKPVADIGKTVVQERLIDYKWYCDPDVNTYMKGKVGTTAIAKTELVDSAATGDGIEEITETGISIIEVVNEPNNPKVTIVKVDEKVNEDGSYKILPGAVFGLYEKDGKTPIKKEDGNNYEVETDKDGKATFEDLEPGTYIIKEIKAPNGYEKTNKTWKVVVGENNKVQVFERIGKEKKKGLNYSISNSGIESTVNFDKGKPGLSITPYIIPRGDGTFICKLDIESRYNTENLDIGIPLSFELDNKNFKYKYNGNYQDSISWDNYPVSYKYGKQTTEFEIIPNDTITAGEYQPISKVLISDGELATGLPTIGFANKVDVNPEPNEIKYTIGQAEKRQIMYDYQNNVLATVYSTISKLNTDNSYRLRIIIKPLQTNYVDVEKTLAAFTLRMNLNDFEVSTEDDFGYNKVSGEASIEMYMYERDPEEISFTITPRDGKFGHLQPVEFFTIGATKVEEKTDTGQHLAYIEVSNSTPQPPTPDPSVEEKPIPDVTQTGNEFSFTVTNKYRGFNVEFLKVNDAGETLNNAEFELKKYNEETGKYEDYKTQNKIKSTDGGKISIEGLKPGVYGLYETVAPEGYNRRLGVVLQFKIDETDGHVEVFDKDKYVPIDNDNKKIVNYNSKNGELIIKKTDSLGNPLSDAVFGLYIGNEIKYKNSQKNDGTISFVNIEPGVYILREIKAPDGYDKTNLTWTVTVYPTGYTTVKANPYKPIDTSHTPVDLGKEKKLEVKDYKFIVQDKPNSKTLKPNQNEFFEISYDIVPKDKDNPGFREGDFFTTQYSKNIRRQGTLNTFTPDDIVVPQGVLAVASYEKRKNDDEGDVVKYTFTKLVEDLSEDMKISIKESLNIDRKAVPYSDQNVNFVNIIAGKKYTNNGGDGFDIDYRVYYNKATNTSSDFVYQIFDNGKIHLSSFINKIDWSNNTLNFISYAKFENFSPNKVKINLSNVKGAVIDSKSKVNVYKVPSKYERTISQSFSSEYNNDKVQHSTLKENQDYVVDYYDNSADLYINDPNSSAIYIIELTTAYDPSVEDAEIREDIICRQNPHCYYPFSVYSSIIIKPSKNSAYGKTSQPEILVKNYEKPDIEFQKVDGKDKAVKLEGAKFTLYKAQKDTNGEYEKVDAALKFGMVDNKFDIIPNVDDEGKSVSEDPEKGYTVTSGKEGKFKFLKLEDGIYAVKETKAPAGYTKLLDYVFYFKVEGTKIYRVNKLGEYVDDTKDKNKVSEAKKDEESLIVNMENDNAQVELIEIENFKAEYPSTGGVGALPFVFIGMMIMMVGAYMFIRRRDALYE